MSGISDLYEGLDEYRDTENALLLDVRDAKEYAEGHLPGAVNLPLSEVSMFEEDYDRPLFLYCQRGSRSRRAAAALENMGYERVKSIGGIAYYKGELEK